MTTIKYLLNDRGWCEEEEVVVVVAARSGDGTDNSNSKEGNDLSDLHLDGRGIINVY